jgi:hypothetical protein
VKTPLSVLIEWWDGVPPEIAEDLAFLASVVLIPHLIPGDHDRDPAVAFRAALIRECDRHLEIAGRALAFATAVDFAFVGRRTQEQWDAKAAENTAMAERIDAERDGKERFAETIRKTLLRFPLRSAMWVREYRRWSALREGPLSVDGIHAWNLSIPVTFPGL